LITIGTPHLGSPLATQLTQTTSACTRGVLALQDLHAFTSAVTPGGTFTGGIGDLKGDLQGTSGSLSSALQAIQPATTKLTVRIPTGLIAGSMTPAQLATVDTSWKARIIRFACSNDPLGAALTSTAWPNLLGPGSDAIVPLLSELAGSTSNTVVPLAPAVHSSGAEQLGFAAGNPPGPSELDSSSGVSTGVLQLLNTNVSDPGFIALP
jgi:hypothetical protein